jgi:hypothetical protein
VTRLEIYNATGLLLPKFKSGDLIWFVTSSGKMYKGKITGEGSTDFNYNIKLIRPPYESIGLVWNVPVTRLIRRDK